MHHPYLPRELPPGLEALTDLALDLRWTWSHGADKLWRALDPAFWERSENPWSLLAHVSRDRLQAMLRDPQWLEQLTHLQRARQQHRSDPGWFGRLHSRGELGRVAYFSMEFGLGEALPLYAGGLGVLAGDTLKAASDLGVPLVGVGLLYQEGYFRQLIGRDGEQIEAYPFNDPIGLPVQPVFSPEGGWLGVELDFPRRKVFLRLWRAIIGRVDLYLLDSNDPINTPMDRGITGKLYGGGHEMRLLQEIVLGIGGWRALEALGIEPEVLHLNEGHAAFALLERARSHMRRHGVPFSEALWITRGGNVFTTHTAVPSGMDSYGRDVISAFMPILNTYVSAIGLPADELLALGRLDPNDSSEPFNMAYLALRGSATTNAVSALHEQVSRRLFQPLFPRWPEDEVPITHVTNGVHMPSWDSPAADHLWESACGKERWREPELTVGLENVSDEDLWSVRGEARHTLVRYTRRRILTQLWVPDGGAVGGAQEVHVFDPNALTLGFARRFTSYKRPALLLADPERLVRILTDPLRPVQLVVAGKAHPEDEEARALVRRWVEFASDPRVRSRVAFLEDYDLTMAEELVRGVDVWLNTPLRPWEACGTSGMKVLVNGGLNLSELDGWWAEAWSPEVGWALGNPAQPRSDGADAQELYELLEGEVIPEFYARDDTGLPRKWIQRVRASMSRLAPCFSADRMVREYIERLHLPAAARFLERAKDGGAVGRELRAWEARLAASWSEIRFGNLNVEREGEQWRFKVQVYLGEVSGRDVQVQLYADSVGELPAVRVEMAEVGEIAGAANAALYQARTSANRPAQDFTPRVVPWHPSALLPLEAPLIRWWR